MSPAEWPPELPGWDAERVRAALPGGRPEHVAAAWTAAARYLVHRRREAARAGTKADAAALAPLAAALAEAARALAALPESARQQLEERWMLAALSTDAGDTPAERAAMAFRLRVLPELLHLLRVAADMQPERGPRPDTPGRMLCFDLFQVWHAATGSLPQRGPHAAGGEGWPAFRSFLDAVLAGLPEAERPRRSLEGIAARTARAMARGLASRTPAQNH